MNILSHMFVADREWMAPYELRYYYLNRFIFFYALFGHILFTPIFYLLNSDLALFNNVTCVFLDLLCLWLNSKKMLKTVHVIFTAEISLHTAFCSLIFGWASGFLFYFFSITFYTFLLVKFKLNRIVMALFVIVLFITHYVYIEMNPPVYPETIIPYWLLFFLNVTANYCAIAFVSAYFSIFVHKAENAIRKAKDKAEKGERAKSVFLANISHEIRSPLNSIVGMINLAQLSDDENMKSEYLGIAKDSADHLLTVINDVLDYSKIEANRMTLTCEVFNLHHLIRNTMMAMDSTIYKRKLEMKYEIAESVPATVKGDPSRIRQVLINLLSNAIKFTEKGSIALTCRNIFMEDDRCVLEFSVRDTGAGIAADKLATIFDRFTQLEAKGKSMYTGTGLGLAISRELVELMGGNIRVESTPGSGSTFTFTIPIVKSEPEHVKTRVNMQIEGTGSRRELNILIAEDMFTSWLLYEKYMSMLGYSYRIVENGCMVLDELENNRYDLVLMDIEMPDMGGEETLNHIRSGARGLDRDIPVIALTGYSESDLYNSENGFDGYVTKPVELHDLDRAINEVVCSKLKTTLIND